LICIGCGADFFVLLLYQVPFRETHHISGSAVRLSEEKGCLLSDLTLEELKKLSPKFEEDVEKVWLMEESVERRDAIGGTSRRAVLEQCERIEKEIAGQ